MTGPNTSRLEDASDLETDLELVAIAAVADNGIIGADGDMPWHIPEDLAHLQRTTTGHPVIMGRVTYESILSDLGAPLPDRTSIVLTSGALEPRERVLVARGLEESLSLAESAARERHGTDRAFVLGGATVYEQLLPATDRLILTEVHEEPAGDTYFPDWNRDAWQEVEREDRDGFAFVEYGRRE